MDLGFLGVSRLLLTMASSSRFVEGVRRVINGGSSSSPVNLEDFPPLHGASHARVTPVKDGAGSQIRVPVCLRGPTRASPPRTGSKFSGAGTSRSGHGDPRGHSGSGALHEGGLDGTATADADPSGVSWSSLFFTKVKLEYVASLIKDGK